MVASVSLQRTNIPATLPSNTAVVSSVPDVAGQWTPVSDKPLQCTMILESEHPYRPRSAVHSLSFAQFFL